MISFQYCSVVETRIKYKFPNKRHRISVTGRISGTRTLEFALRPPTLVVVEPSALFDTHSTQRCRVLQLPTQCTTINVLLFI